MLKQCSAKAAIVYFRSTKEYVYFAPSELKTGMLYGYQNNYLGLNYKKTQKNPTFYLMCN
jgi:hypothetical protein